MKCKQSRLHIFLFTDINVEYPLIGSRFQVMSLLYSIQPFCFPRAHHLLHTAPLRKQEPILPEEERKKGKCHDGYQFSRRAASRQDHITAVSASHSPSGN